MNAFLIFAAEQKANALGSLLPLLILAPLAYVLIVPQRKQKKKQAEMMASLKVGDEVVTSGGIHGSVNFLEDNIAHVLVDTDVVIRVTKSALTVRPSGDDAVDVTDHAEKPGDVAEKSASNGASKPSKSAKTKS